MYRIYIDEVGTASMSKCEELNNRYLSLTGIIVDLNYMNSTIAPTLEEWKQKYFSSNPQKSPVIFHRKEMINRRPPFDSLSDKEIEKEFNTNLLEKLNEWNYTVITILIDKQKHKEKYSCPAEPYFYCFQCLLERYYIFLNKRGIKGDVMIESRGKKEDVVLKRAYSEYYNEGAEYIKKDDFRRVFTSKELKVKNKESNENGLQLADLLAYPSRQYVFEFHEIERKERKTFNDKIIEILKTKYEKDWYGRIANCGIKLLP